MPPPPPQTPDHEEKSGLPLHQRPGHKAGDFIERDLWNLDEEWGQGSRQAAAAGEDAPPAERDEEAASTPADDTAPTGNDEPEEIEDGGEIAEQTPAAEPAEPPAPTTPEEEDDWDEFAGDDSPEAHAPAPAARDKEQKSRSAEEPAAVLTQPVDDDDPAEQETEPAGGTAEEPEQEIELQLDLEHGGETADEPEPGLTPEADSDSGEASADLAEVDSEWEVDLPETLPTEEPEVSDEFEDPDESEDPDFEDELLGTAPVPEPEPQKGTKRKRLSIFEVISLAIVLVMFVAGAGWALKTFFADIPTRKSQVLVPDFPVRGELVTIKGASSFWREPIRSGPNPDTARRDAKLIPALELTIKDAKSDGALRVFFRDEAGQLVGDSVTHGFKDGVFLISGSDQLQLAATAGFDDEGKHAAYQTAQTEPWKVEVFEGPGERASFESFTLLFEMPISAERR